MKSNKQTELIRVMRMCMITIPFAFFTYMKTTLEETSLVLDIDFYEREEALA